MTYDDMPVGTVLRNAETQHLYLRIEDDSSAGPWQWRRMYPDGSADSLATTYLPPGLVELVEKSTEMPKRPAGRLPGPIPRGECPDCGRDVPLRTNGKPFRHGKRHQGLRQCPGGGL